MSDTIYRRDAINALEELSACEEYGVEVGTDEETYIGKYEAITTISDLPPAYRQCMDRDDLIRLIQEAVYDGEACARLIDIIDQPQGWWEIYVVSPYDGEDCRCSECGAIGCVPYWDYCPHCGAHMKGAKNA